MEMMKCIVRGKLFAVAVLVSYMDPTKFLSHYISLFSTEAVPCYISIKRLCRCNHVNIRVK